MEGLGGDAAHYSFLPRADNTLPHHLPPDIDDKPLGRQKRKRTSPEDQAVLEAAYKRDPKPDKAARVKLVEEVSLGEKEVQIWFQNRRQSSRRKSRPLLPHEIAQYQTTRYGPFPHDGSSDGPPSDGLDAQVSREERVEVNEEALGVPPQRCYSVEVVRPQEHNKATEPVVPGHVASVRVDTLDTPGNPENMETPSVKKEPLGYLANRRSAPSLHLVQQREEFSQAAPPALERPLRKSSSYVRLSMSFDGNASIVTKDGSSPSPPRAPQILVPGLDGSTIASPQLHQQGNRVSPRNGLQRSASGRSRDSRAWQFWCDKDARSELEDKAEKDSNGSAADAIGLLRSGRSILGSIPAKRNSLLSRSPIGAKRVKLQRSQTSFGRMQGRPDAAEPMKPKLKHAGSAVSVYVPGNDSDKENWSPDGERSHSAHHAPYNQTSATPILGQARNACAARSKSFGYEHGDENLDPDVEPETSASVRGGRKSSSMSSEDDLDCVQGLLSLSQGNWR